MGAWRVVLELDVSDDRERRTSITVDMPGEHRTLPELHDLARDLADNLGLLHEGTTSIGVRLTFPGVGRQELGASG